MTDDTIKDDEPSIEEILSSIRDIISDDDEEEENKKLEGKTEEPIEEKVEPTPAPEAPSNEPVIAKEEDDEDVLDLTDIAEEQEDTVPEDNDIDIDAMFKNEDKADDPLAGIDLAHPSDDDLEITDSTDAINASIDDLGNDDGVDDILSSFGEDESDMSEPETNTTVDADALLNNAASSATVSSLARLAENIAVSRTASGTTLEDIVRELLRPMLKEWLDDNLPDVIERLVAKELERLAEKASRK